MNLGAGAALTALLAGALAGPGGALVVATALLAFGALAVLPPGLTGGAALTAAPVGYAVFVLCALARCGPRALARAALDPGRLGLLTLYAGLALAATLVLPGLFSGRILTYPLRGDGAAPTPAPVGYSGANLTQALYLALSYAVSLAVAVLAAGPGFDRAFRRAFLALAALLIASGLADLLGFGAALAPLRTASYALAGDTSLASARRVVGAMPEASSFGGTAASVFAVLVLLRDRFRVGGLRDGAWLACAMGTGALALLSTSTTACAVVLAVGAAFAIQAGLGVLAGGPAERGAAVLEIGAALALALLAGLAVLWDDDLWRLAAGLVDEVVLRKALSASFEERSRWTAAGLDAVLASGGLGVGVGSVRTSNGLVNILASTGVAGALCLALFLARLLRAPARRRRAAWAARLALLPLGTGFALAGTTPDYGPVVAIVLGLLADLTAEGRGPEPAAPA